MTLFETRTWWTTSPGARGDDAFDQGCLLVANIEPTTAAQQPQARVVTGSFSGLLRVYLPTSRENTPEDLLLEKQLTQAILQLDVVYPNSPVLLVLHPRSLVGYRFQSGSDGGEPTLQVAFEHALKRTACNVTRGTFGGSPTELFCVQSMDGVLTFFNQDGFAFERFLPNFLLPGPLCYVPDTDSFVTATPSGTIEAYRYLTLASASDGDGSKGTAGKRVKVDWSTVVGEFVLDIVFVSGYPFIIVLGERTIFWIKSSGGVHCCKRLESNPSCLLAYRIVDDSINLLVGTHDNGLVVLKDTSIVWGAKLDGIPVALRVGRFGGVAGMIVSLEDSGTVTLMYMGTDPTIPVLPQPHARELMYDEMDAELQQLQAVIRGVALGEQPPQVTDLVEIVLQEPLTLNTRPGAEEDLGLALPVEINYAGDSTLENVCVQVHQPPFLNVDSAQHYLPTLGPSVTRSASIVFRVGVRKDMLPSTCRVPITASYMTGAGEPRVVETTATLLLSAFCTRTPPSKSAHHKITMMTNHNVVQLAALFADVPAHAGLAAVAGNAIGIRVNTGASVTLVTSKTGSKYRLQSDSLPALGCIAQAFCDRLHQHLADVQPPLSITFGEPLPLQPYFHLVDEHLKCRHDLVRVRSLMDQRAQQLRALQKRLLLRFKDKTPSPLNHLDTLLEGTYQELLSLADTEEEAQSSLARASNELSAGTRLLVLLLRSSQASKEELDLVEAALFPDVGDCQEQGWEEIVYTAMSHLLKTKFAKSAKDIAVNPTPLQMPDDTTKLKKQIAVVCERTRAAAQQAAAGVQP
eukprot:m.214801 g.214801  ORF g.214801 m.214801 type:complete len:803 (-) comp18624_c0_seq7:92-2500(-)